MCVCVSVDVITPSDFYTAPNTARTALVEKRVEVALRHLLFFVLSVCLSELNIVFSLLSGGEQCECVCV